MGGERCSLVRKTGPHSARGGGGDWPTRVVPHGHTQHQLYVPKARAPQRTAHGVECRHPGAHHSHRRQSVHRVGACTHNRAQSLSAAVCAAAHPRPRGPSLQGHPACARWAGRVPVPSCPAVDATAGGLRLCKAWRGGTFQQTALRTRTPRRGGGRAQRAPAKGRPACTPGGGAQGPVERVPPPQRGAGGTPRRHTRLDTANSSHARRATGRDSRRPFLPSRT